MACVKQWTSTTSLVLICGIPLSSPRLPMLMFPLLPRRTPAVSALDSLHRSSAGSDMQHPFLYQSMGPHFTLPVIPQLVTWPLSPDFYKPGAVYLTLPNTGVLAKAPFCVPSGNYFKAPLLESEAQQPIRRKSQHFERRVRKHKSRWLFEEADPRVLGCQPESS